MPPTTRQQNKTKHPGLLDLPVVAPAATGPPGSRLQEKQKAKSKPEQDSITRQVAALEVDLLTQQQQARASACQPPGPPQKKQPHAWSTMYRTKVSSGLEAKNDSDEGGNRKTRKQQPTSGEESEAASKRKSWQRKKWKGTTGEGIPAATWGSTVASVQKVSKSTIGARSQVATGSNATELIVAHTGSNPEAAMTVDNNTMGVDDGLDEANPGKIMSKTQWRVTQIKSNVMKTPDVNAMGSQHHTDGSTSNPNAAPQDRYKSSYGGLDDGDDANNAPTQVPYTNGTHTSQNPFSPHALAFHLTLNGEPTSPLICLKKLGSISPHHANVESECGYLTIDKHWVGSGEEGCDHDGYRGDNAGSDQDKCSDDNDNDDNDNNNNGSSNNSDAPALTCTTLHAMEQSGLNVRAFKKGSSNSFKPVVRVFNHSLTHKVPSMEQPGQQVQKPGPPQNQASGAPSHTQGHSHHAVEADEENFETHKFHNEDLLGHPYTMAPSHDIILPYWIFYFSSLNSPWKLANPLHVAHIRKLWAKTFPNINCTVALCNVPIFALIHPLAFYLVTILIMLEVKQFEAFFDQYKEVDTAKAQAAYVAWAVPELVAPSLFPYMWERVEEGPDGPIPKGTFQHNCILDTFTFYLESSSVIKPSVERAFQAWSTGQYIPLPKAQKRFSQALWGYATNGVMESVDCLSAKQWKRILLSAENNLKV
ncbi:hypothetical protein EDD16DRAFT_1525614 [Pisolithus croceorrhizus]|nr:hypothetical protein EDD16DRAFT_1525614 [Pisolithus croceorrhizus]KAI6162801.1 hypothetical protein EDD17DRAFT_1507675 [Pisolithus thermaeus]